MRTYMHCFEPAASLVGNSRYALEDGHPSRAGARPEGHEQLVRLVRPAGAAALLQALDALARVVVEAHEDVLPVERELELHDAAAGHNLEKHGERV